MTRFSQILFEILLGDAGHAEDFDLGGVPSGDSVRNTFAWKMAEFGQRVGGGVRVNGPNDCSRRDNVRGGRKPGQSVPADFLLVHLQHMHHKATGGVQLLRTVRAAEVALLLMHQQRTVIVERAVAIPGMVCGVRGVMR